MKTLSNTLNILFEFEFGPHSMSMKKGHGLKYKTLKFIKNMMNGIYKFLTSYTHLMNNNNHICINFFI